jgi:hypothetical protein
MPATIFELGHQLAGDLLFGLPDGAPDSQARVAVDGDASPEGAVFVGFLVPPFSPLLPT